MGLRVARIWGLNIRAARRHLGEVLGALGMEGRELPGGRIVWRWPGGEDFVQIFPAAGAQGVEWHHIEFVMEGASYEEAVRDVLAKGVDWSGARVVVGSDLVERARGDFGHLGKVSVESRGRTCPWNLYVYSTSPAGFDYELFY